MIKFLDNIKLGLLYRFIIAIEAIFLLQIFFLILRVEHTRSEIINNHELNYNVYRIAQELEESSDHLTQMARLFTMTGDLKYKDYYFTILGIRNGDIERPDNYSSVYWDIILAKEQNKSMTTGKKDSFLHRLQQINNLSRDEIKPLEIALERSRQLNNLEAEAFNAMAGLFRDVKGNYTIHGKPKPEYAKQLLNDKKYLYWKGQVMQPISDFSEKMDQILEHNFYQLENKQRYNILYLKLCILINLIFLGIAYLAVSRSLKQLHIMTDQVQKISEGNYHTRNNLTMNNELGILARILNTMSASILRAMEEQARTHSILTENEARFRGMVENSMIGTGIINLQGKFIFANEAFCQLLGYTHGQLLQTALQDIVYPEDWPKELDLLHQLMEQKLTFSHATKKFMHKEGKPVWTLSNISIIKDRVGKTLQIIIQIVDFHENIENEKHMVKLNQSLVAAINELKQNEQSVLTINKLNELLQMCLTSRETFPIISLLAKQLFPDLSGGLAIFNKTNGIIETVAQWGKDQILTESFMPADCFALRSGNPILVDDPKTVLLCSHFKSAYPGGYFGIPMIMRHNIIGLLCFIAPIHSIISHKQQQLAIQFSNIIKIALSNIQLRELLQEESIIDPLTKLYNRRFMDENLTILLQQIKRTKEALCIAMLDLDFFKMFNDKYGHEAGDEVLKYIGSLLLDSFRGSDFVCRFGGEEFLVILHANLDIAVKKLQKLCDDVRNAEIFYRENKLPQITISIGLTMVSDLDMTKENIIIEADHALYLAKSQGKNRVVVFSR